jgi:RHS repeat-associated protein
MNNNCTYQWLISVNRYKPFTGKERDEETGYSYFGARYMDADLLTCWLSVDPMADKYPSLSPYNYCAWNPIKLTDPNGDSIDAKSMNEINKMFTNYEWEMNHCNSEKRSKMEESLINIQSEIETLQKSNQWYSINRMTIGEYNNSPGDGIIHYNTETNVVEIKFMFNGSMLHELKHAFQFETGKLSFGSNGNHGICHDLNDEVEANERGALLYGMLISIEDLQSLDAYKDLEKKSVYVTENSKCNSDIEPQLDHDYYRNNGNTYFNGKIVSNSN